MIYLLSFLAYEFKSEFNAQSNIGLEFGVIFYFSQNVIYSMILCPNVTGFHLIFSDSQYCFYLYMHLIISNYTCSGIHELVDVW